jgi:hypothetical protein
MKTNHLVQTIVTSSDFVECNGAKLYREPMETNGGSKFSISFAQFGKPRVIFYKIAGRNFIKITRSDGSGELTFWCF